MYIIYCYLTWWSTLHVTWARCAVLDATYSLPFSLCWLFLYLFNIIWYTYKFYALLQSFFRLSSTMCYFLWLEWLPSDRSHIPLSSWGGTIIGLCHFFTFYIIIFCAKKDLYDLHIVALLLFIYSSSVPDRVLCWNLPGADTISDVLPTWGSRTVPTRTAGT